MIERSYTGFRRRALQLSGLSEGSSLTLYARVRLPNLTTDFRFEISEGLWEDSCFKCRWHDRPDDLKFGKRLKSDILMLAES